MFKHIIGMILGKEKSVEYYELMKQKNYIAVGQQYDLKTGDKAMADFTQNVEEQKEERIDLLDKDFCNRMSYREIHYILLSDKIPYHETYVTINIYTGQLKKVETHCEGAFGYIRERHESIDVNGVKEFAKKCSEELGEKFTNFSEDNWKSFIPSVYYIRSEKDLHPKKKTVKKPQNAACIPDFDAYYICIQRNYGDDMVFLRKTDKGWRALARTGSIEPKLCTEQYIYDFMNLNRDTDSQIYRAYDRRLTDKDMNYFMEILPPNHPEERAEGLESRSTPISMWKNDRTVAYYEKNGQWIPCADYENIVEIYDRIDELAEYELEYE